MQGLGYGILLGSTLVKVPQVVNVVRARSAGERATQGACTLRSALQTLAAERRGQGAHLLLEPPPRLKTPVMHPCCPC